MRFPIEDCPSWAHRRLRFLTQYEDLRNDIDNRYAAFITPYLDRDERLIGIHQNQKGSIENSIIITNKGLYHYKDKHLNTIKFKQIANIGRVEDKHKDIYLKLILKDSSIYLLPVIPENERGGRDLFTFLTFLKRVLYEREGH